MFDLFATFLGEMWLGIPGSDASIYAGTTRFACELADDSPTSTIESDGFLFDLAQDDEQPSPFASTITPN